MPDAVGAILTLPLLGTLLLLVFDWIRVARLYRGSRLAALRQMLFTVRKSEDWWILLLVPLNIGGILYLWSDPLFRETVEVAVVVPGMIAIALSSLLIRLRPPAVLFLGSSRDGKKLFRSIRTMADRYRVVAFLTPSIDDGPVGVGDLMIDGLRTRRVSDWMPIVSRLMEMVPLTVVDTRTVTPSVVEEVRYLLQPHLRKRAIFVATDFGTLPALDAIRGSFERADLYITTTGECAHAICDRLRMLKLAPRNPAPGRRLREAAARERFEQIDGDEYLNGKHGVRIRGLNDWIVTDFTRDFEANGGFLALASPDESAAMNLSSGPLSPLTAFVAASGERREFVDAWKRYATERFEEDRRLLRCGEVERRELTDIDGEKEVLWLESSSPEGQVGKVCALHRGDEYVLFYLVRSGSSEVIEEILRNWKWFIRLRAGLTGLGGRGDL